MIFVEWHFINQLHDHVLPLGLLFAQRVRDPQVIEQMQQAFQNFVQSGQVWALLIGMFFGYIFRGFTSF